METTKRLLLINWSSVVGKRKDSNTELVWDKIEIEYGSEFLRSKMSKVSRFLS